MKLFGKIFGMALTLLAAVGVVACTNDLSEKNLSPENIGAIKPVKTPDAIVWSGNTTFSNSLNKSSSNQTRADLLFQYSGKTLYYDELEEHEKTAFSLIKKFADGEVSNDITKVSTDFIINIPMISDDNYEFRIFLIYSNYKHYDLPMDNKPYIDCYYKVNQGFSEVNMARSFESLLIPFNSYSGEFPYSFAGDVLYLQPSISSFVFSVYWGSSTKSEEYFTCADQTNGITSTEPERFCLFRVLSGDETEYFMGFDYNGNGDYTDFIFWLPDLLSWTSEEEEPEITPGGGDSGTTNPSNPDENDGGDKGEEDNTPDDSSTSNGPKFVESEVEVNFALEDVHGNYDIEDLVTKLSIHVRYPHDVEVIIPVPEDFYCDQDDLYILKNHYNGNYVYGGESITYSNLIDDNNVSLTVQYVPAEDDDFTGKNQGYIRVYTEGINEEVIRYCQENFGDGINFEVYNYYNKGTMGYGNFKEISYFDLQYNYLSHSMVNFDWEKPFGEKVYPNLYVNAFNQIKGEPNWGDCYVWIFGDERARYNTDLYKETVTYTGPKGIATGEMKWSDSTSAEDYSVERNCFQDPYQGYHKNSSELNWIYVVKGGKTPGDASETKMPSNPFPFPTTAPQQILVNGSPETCPNYVAK